MLYCWNYFDDVDGYLYGNLLVIHCQGHFHVRRLTNAEVNVRILTFMWGD